MTTVPRHSSFRRKSMLSRFVDTEHSAKNHKEFIAGQLSKPVGLYARPAGQFSQAAANSNHFS